ncbi:MAG: sulfur oxidation c-type cytochrome SoxA, partial [Albidovulum sp.]
MKMKTLASTCAVVALAGMPVWAGPADDTLVINGETEIVTHTEAAPDYIDGLSEQYSGWHFRNADTRDMERDDFDNAGMLGVEAAMASWDTVDGSEGKACASCHESPDSMVGVRPQMPKFNEAKGTMYTLEMYINDCR